ncbi:fimbria/pilus outer membrane usher protein [Pseudomonas rubra]|uniref:Fimbrial biogenesis outer membrane usher protein n=1 Tax=Pseudomonas rubra TaxID=2942627 RepID=A0ABT5P8N5_9PSED|nr:fimbria/pilus outer membrane usher protein [Pseudomonas rubra]MDD1014618.1 fimbrial biogenesis outer membrane usher protein [Pseudomonas rubra]MDD1040567.1 fimbrial biogenesis outer membrane usher protein [Pseudomonas rubra]MDD1153589.1 fimbrial biogenesis outer membrane usher protein [Pseudomonas rubra]
MTRTCPLFDFPGGLTRGRTTIFLGSLSFVSLPPLAMAETPEPLAIQFESAFLSNGTALAVDLSRFEKRNIVAAGAHNVEVFINQQWQGRLDVAFESQGAGQDAFACFDQALLHRLGIATDRLASEHVVQLASGHCLHIEAILADAFSEFDFSRQQLSLSIPQIWLKRASLDYVDPGQWDSGVSAGFIGYNLNVYNLKPRNQQEKLQTQGYLGLNSGVNLGNWRLRHDGALSWSNQGLQHYQSHSSYAQRDITPWSSQLTLGETYTPGDLFNSVSFIGARLASDDRMLPHSQSGFAPVVRGVANSNARVVVRQRGVILHESTVAPGAFEIDDLQATGYGGDLGVEITEADGQVRSFSVPYTAVPLSLRPGQQRYSTTFGTLQNPLLVSEPVFVEGNWQYGLNNLLSSYSGLTFASGYGALLLGGALNTSLGAFGLDVTQARTHLPGLGSQQGQSLRVSYAKTLNATDTQVALATHRYSTQGYFNLEDAFLNRQYWRGTSHSLDFLHQRSRSALTLGQPLAERYGQVHLTTSATRYWNYSGTDVNYSLGYSNHFKRLTYGLSAARERSASGRRDNVLNLTFSLPLGPDRSKTLNTSASRSQQGHSQMQTTLSGIADTENRLSYGVTASHDRHHGEGNSNLSGNLLYRSPVAELSGSLSHGKNLAQSSFGARGAVVAHEGGITLSQPLGETFGLARAEHATGARLSSFTAATVDRHGYAVIPSLTPYRSNRVELDPKGLSTDIELQGTVQQTVPRAGAIPLLEFQTVSGRSAVIHLLKPDGRAIAFGSVVKDEDGIELGIVGQGSQAFVRGLKERGTLGVSWGNSPQQSCTATYSLTQHSPSGLRTAAATCESSQGREPDANE